MNSTPPPTLPAGVLPVTITSTNCSQLVGASWKWVQLFARAHGVPIMRIGKLRLIEVAPLIAAFRAAALAATPLTLADEAARWKAEITQKLRRHT